MRRRSWQRRRGPFYVELNLSSVHRPYLLGSWSDERTWNGALMWGEPGSDPVWMLDWTWHLPEPVGRGFDRYYARGMK